MQAVVVFGRRMLQAVLITKKKLTHCLRV